MSTLPMTPKTLPMGPQDGQTLVRRWDLFLGSLASGIGLPEAMLRHKIVRAEIETMTRLPGDAGVVERKRWEQARLAGRKTEYTTFDLEDIFTKISEGKKLADAVAEVKGSDISKAGFWKCVQQDAELRARYKEAKEIGAMAAMEDAVAIADDDTQDIIPGPKGDIPNMAAVNRSRLRVEERWRQAKALARETYGDKSEQTINLNVNHAEWLEEARTRARGQVKITKAERAQALEADFQEVAPVAPLDTSWMDEKPTDTTWREEQ